MRRRARSRVRVATLLLCASLALPAAAADNGPSVGSKIFDCAVLRPLGFVATIIGGAFFVPAAFLASGACCVPATVLLEHRDRARAVEGTNNAWEHFVGAQVEYTFRRPLGEF